MIGTSTENKLSHVVKLHRVLKNRQIILAFEGGFTQNMTKNILAMIENSLKSEELQVKKKVFNVMVECLQNICKYADDSQTEDQKKVDREGIFMIGKNIEGYFLLSGNFIKNSNISELEGRIKEINELDKEGLKNLYLNKLVENQIHDRGGAGLGLIDIARKSGQSLEYSFEPINEQISFYSLSTKIARK